MTYLVPYTGLRGLGRLRNDMDDLWNRFFDVSNWPAASQEGAFVPSLNVKETDEAYEVTAEVPGLKPEDIKVEFRGGVLTLSGEKKEEKEETKGSYHVVERRFGSFSRSVRVPAEVDVSRLEANHKDGVLLVHLPKSAKNEGRTIEVKAR